MADKRQEVEKEGDMKKRIVSLIPSTSIMTSQDNSSFQNEKLRFNIIFKVIGVGTIKLKDVTTPNQEGL